MIGAWSHMWPPCNHATNLTTQVMAVTTIASVLTCVHVPGVAEQPSIDRLCRSVWVHDTSDTSLLLRQNGARLDIYILAM